MIGNKHRIPGIRICEQFENYQYICNVIGKSQCIGMIHCILTFICFVLLSQWWPVSAGYGTIFFLNSFYFVYEPKKYFFQILHPLLFLDIVPDLKCI